MSAIDRFKAKVVKTPCGCHEWQSTIHRDGYGRFYFNGKNMQAHRVAYVLKFGLIPEGGWVLHKCDNRKCVNPDHLYVGDAKQNSKDRTQRLRYKVVVPISRVHEIRALYATGDLTQQKIAEMTGVRQTQVSRYVRGTQRLYR